MANGDRQTLFERIIANAQSAVSSLSVKSAINPMLWLCGIVSVPSLLLAFLSRENHDLMQFFLYVAAAPILASVIGFLYFMIRDPQRLQSEDYQIRHETLEFIRQKGSSLEISPLSLEAITNPRALPPPSEER